MTALGVVLPAATILFWLVRGVGQGEAVQLAAAQAGNSLMAGLLAALAVAVFALPVAALVTRFPGRFAAVVEGILYSAYAVPGIVVALAAVFFVLAVTPIVYQSLLVLVLAYAVRFMPAAVGPMRASFSAVGPRLLEAGRSLGDSPQQAFRKIALPLVRPGIVAGMALVFLTTVKELPLTLLLAPTGFSTLATSVWSAATEGFYARAAVPAATLMILSMLTVGVLFRAEEPRQ